VLSKEDYVLVQLLGRDTPEVQALVAAAGQPGFEGAAHEMLRGLARHRGWNPDDLPPFALPRNLSPSDYPVGTAMSGEVPGEVVGPSEEDLPAHIGVFGQTGTGKSTLVKLLVLSFMGVMGGKPRPGRRLFIWDAHGEYRDLLRLFDPDDLLWLSADEIGVNPFEVPQRSDGQPVVPPEKWINELREWFRLCWLNEPSLNLLCEVLHGEYERRGLLGGANV
jgi:hypothetical protein